MLSQSELDAIRSRAEAASPPPWPDHCPDLRQPDATFIAHARTDVPALLDEVERLQADMADVRKSLSGAFYGIETDDDGQPEDTDMMAYLAGNRVKSADSHAESETERANVAEHKVSQLRSRFALELAARTTPDMERQAARITELEDINGGLRAWQDVARPKLEARMDKAESRVKELELSQHPRPISEAPQDGTEVLAWVPHLGWAALSWSHVSDCWVGHTREYPTHWVYLPSPVDDTYSRGATP